MEPPTIVRITGDTEKFRSTFHLISEAFGQLAAAFRAHPAFVFTKEEPTDA